VLLGKATFNYFAHLAKTAVRRAVVETPASRPRYYVGLAIMLVSWLPAYLYAYLPGAFPGGDTRIYILAVMDLAFVASVFLMGQNSGRRQDGSSCTRARSNAPFTPPARLAGPAG
jgi:hypothetical protein